MFSRYPRNARFWTWTTGGYVKLTLRPGESLTHVAGGRTDEGFYTMSESFEHLGDRVVSDTHEHGRDCDGRYSFANRHFARLTDLRASSNECPQWQQLSGSQRDYAAEAAGY